MVVPVISIALATLVSTTVNVLRQGEVDLQSLVNKEACELRLLRRAVFGMFGTRQHAGWRSRALALMYGYSGLLFPPDIKSADIAVVTQLNPAATFVRPNCWSMFKHSYFVLGS